MASREWWSLGDQVREGIVLLQANVPVRLTPIAQFLGVQVKAATLPAGISGEIRPVEGQPDRYVIRVNRHDSEKRQRFTVAHEIGHFLLHRAQIGSGIRDDALYRSNLSDKREAEANRLAADILMPDHLISDMVERAKALRVEDVVVYLAEQFNVSEASMKIRLGLA